MSSSVSASPSASISASPSASASSAYDASFDVAITGEDTGINILTKTGITAAFQYRPRQACQLNTDGSALEFANNYIQTDDVVVAQERIKIIVTNAGGGKRQGTFRIWIGQ